MFSYFKNKNKNKKRSEYVDEVKIFIQVHFVRERGGERDKYNTLSIKTDPDRDSCKEWYLNHNNPTNFFEVVQFYLSEKGIKAETLMSKYNLDSSVLSGDLNSLTKGDAIAICIGLNLNIAETIALLETADFALSNSSQADLALRYCIENRIYDLGDIEYLLTTVCSTRLKEII